MGYTLTRTWKRQEGAGIRERRETSDGGETYAETERRARAWWSATAAMGDAVEGTTVVEIQDASGRAVACLRDSMSGAPTLSPAGAATPATMRWLTHLREAGVLAERVRQSTERLSCLGSGDLAGEAGAETLDACVARLKALVFRVDEILGRSLVASGRDGQSRLDARQALDAALDEADIDGYLAMTTDGRIQVPPSTLPPERIPAVVEATVRVSAAMLQACDIIEAHAAAMDLQTGPALGR